MPATIAYEVSLDNGEKREEVIRFHTIVSEGHSATSQITKFPVQNGFEVSNHAIRRNRVVDVSGVFTNTVLKGTGQIQYSKHDTPKEMFTVLESLVLGAIPCKVVTNLGVYYPVIFTKFETIQKGGLIDSIAFAMSGEEVQVEEVIASSAPKVLSFVEVGRFTKEQLATQWEEAGLPFSTQASVKQAQVLFGTDFTVTSKDVSGKPTQTTFECVGYDDVTGAFSYLQHTSVTDLFQEKVASVTDLVSASPFDVSGGLLGTSNCILAEVGGASQEAAEELLDTAIGKLQDSAFGALQDILSLGGSGSIAQSMLGFTVDCVASQVSQEFGSEAASAGEVITQGISSIEKKGQELIGGSIGGIDSITTIPATITQISTYTGPLESLGITF